MLGPILAALLSTTPASTERVSIVAPSADDPVVVALVAELETLGLEASFVPEPGGSPGIEELRAIGRRNDVVAAIWISADQTSLIIWVDDRDKGRAIVRELPAPRDGEEEVVVLRAVELLRASLREIEDAPDPDPPPDPAPVPAPVREQPRPPRRHPIVTLDLGPALAGAQGSIGVSAHIAAGVRVQLHRIVGVRLSALAPTVGREVSGTEGSARIAVAHVLIGPHFVLRAPDKIWQPDLGVAAGLSIVRMDGRADPPFESRTDHVLGAALRAGAGFAVVVHPRLRLRADASVGLVLPKAEVAFGDRSVAAWGLVHGVGSVGVEFPFSRPSPQR